MMRIDGHSILGYAVKDRRQQDRGLLIQAGSRGKKKATAWKWRGVRTEWAVQSTNPDGQVMYLVESQEGAEICATYKVPNGHTGHKVVSRLVGEWS